MPCPGELSLRWYREILHRPDFGDAFVKSLILGGAATGLSLGIGSLAAYGLVRHRFPGRTALGTLFLAPLMVPGVVLGLFLLIFFANLRLDGTFGALLAGHVLITVPYLVRTMAAGFAMLDPQLELAARNLGRAARPWRPGWSCPCCARPGWPRPASPSSCRSTT
jgi:putative spermidine/putrescine transport system permease protein